MTILKFLTCDRSDSISKIYWQVTVSAKWLFIKGLVHKNHTNLQVQHSSSSNIHWELKVQSSNVWMTKSYKGTHLYTTRTVFVLKVQSSIIYWIINHSFPRRPLAGIYVVNIFGYHSLHCTKVHKDLISISNNVFVKGIKNIHKVCNDHLRST